MLHDEVEERNKEVFEDGTYADCVQRLLKGSLAGRGHLRIAPVNNHSSMTSG